MWWTSRCNLTPCHILINNLTGSNHAFYFFKQTSCLSVKNYGPFFWFHNEVHSILTTRGTNITFKIWEQGVQGRSIRMKWSRNIFFQEWKKKSKLGSENQSDNLRSPWGFAKLRCFSGRVSLKPTDHCLSILRTAPPKQSHNNNCLCEMLSENHPFS